MTSALVEGARPSRSLRFGEMAGRQTARLTPVLLAYSSVVFADSPWIGATLLIATLLHPAVGLAGLTATLAATAAARGLGYRADAVDRGYYGYNALLIGLALAMGRGFDLLTFALCILAGIASALLTAALGDLLHRAAGLPALALPFVLLTTALLPALPPASSGAISPRLALLTIGLPVTATGNLLVQSFGAILFEPDVLTGLLVFLACLAASRIAATSALVGMISALVMSTLLHPTPAATLPAAYNAGLTALAMGAFFFVPGRAATLVAVGASALSAWVSFTLAALLAHAALPVLAWPFVLVTLVGLRALHLRAPDRAPWPAPLPGKSPEANFEYAAHLAERFGIPGPPQLYLPVAGTWIVSQGAHGEHTHNGAWEGALDFEQVDDGNFPFRNEGLETTDYYCFNAPVHAPAAGTVVLAQDGLSDGRPGDMDLTHPWGNAIVLQHGPELFTVLAHVKQGSITVQPGAYVSAGQVVAACGSSGRSPRPHLHLQAQRTAALGAPAIPFQLRAFTLVGEKPRYVPFGLPREGDRVAAAAPDATVRAFAALPPGATWELRDEVSARPVRLRSEITPLGERYLQDLGTGDRLYFVAEEHGLVFTSYAGSDSGALRALFLALPRVPAAAGASFDFEDRPPAPAMLSTAARWLLEVVRLFVDPVRTHARCSVRTSGERREIEAILSLGVTRAMHARFRGRTTIDARGIVSVELMDLRSSKPLLRARRAG